MYSEVITRRKKAWQLWLQPWPITMQVRAKQLIKQINLMKLYTLYAPPNHRDGVVHHTRADVDADNEHFDGKTTE